MVTRFVDITVEYRQMHKKYEEEATRWLQTTLMF